MKLEELAALGWSVQDDNSNGIKMFWKNFGKVDIVVEIHGFNVRLKVKDALTQKVINPGIDVKNESQFDRALEILSIKYNFKV